MRPHMFVAGFALLVSAFVPRQESDERRGPALTPGPKFERLDKTKAVRMEKQNVPVKKKGCELKARATMRG